MRRESARSVLSGDWMPDDRACTIIGERASAQDRRADALAILDEALAIANTHDARAIVRQIEQARSEI